MPPKEPKRDLSEYTTLSLKISMIRRDGGTQPRAQISEELVAEYAEDMKQGAIFPPVTIFYDGKDHWLADGFHRVKAKEAINEKGIMAEVHYGTRRAAVLYGVGANAAHGLRRTNADKRRSVAQLLRDPEWSQWSDREIARRCGVHHQLVGNLRKNLYSLDDSSSEYRIGGDGRIINITNIGKSDKEEDDKSTKRKRIKKTAPTPKPIVDKPYVVKKGDIWRLGKSHLLFCGNAESSIFQKHLPKKIALLLFFPRAKTSWLSEEPTNVQNTLLFHSSYGEDLHLETLRGIVENCLSGTTNANEPVVMINLIDPSLFILIHELECSCYCAEPEPQRCTDALIAWTAINQPVKKL